MGFIVASKCPVCGETSVGWAKCSKCGATWCQGVDCGKRIDKTDPGEIFCQECRNKAEDKK